MKLAVITDTSAFLPQGYWHEGLYVLDIEISIDGQGFIEGKNLTLESFYSKMAQAKDLPKTSQPSLAVLDETLTHLENDGYTHVIGLFLSSGISGFYQNIQYLIEEHSGLTIAFPDSKITSSPLGMMVENIFKWEEEELAFEDILARLDQQIAGINAFILVDDLNHLVKGGRLSNGAALLGNLLSIKPILYFKDGRIEVYEKIRTEKKAIKRLLSILDEVTAEGSYAVDIIHANVPSKAEALKDMLTEAGYHNNVRVVPFNGIIATHLGEGAIALGITPII